jgi:hypothetical protein
MTLDTTVDSKDRGDDTLRRFKFQLTYAGIVSLSLLDNSSGVCEVFCEHHEDILVKLINGQFIGVQVKTRDLGLGPFETETESIWNCLKKFVALESRFPGRFLRFTIVSNAGFYNAKESVKNLKWIVGHAKGGNGSEMLKPRSKTKTAINRLAKECKCSATDVISVLAKIELKGDAAPLNHVDLDLENRLSLLTQVAEQTSGAIKEVAKKIIFKHLEASSLTSEPSLTEEYISLNSIEDEAKQKVIDGKRITKELLEQLISQGLAHPVTLHLQAGDNLDGMPKETRKLVLKMDKGNISFENVGLQKDNKFAAEKHFISWIHKYGNEKASKQYGQVKLIVQNECQAAYDESFKKDEAFGTEMLRDLRKRLRGRLDAEKQSFFDCKQEHLLGMAGILTEECKVWWSEKFPI